MAARLASGEVEPAGCDMFGLSAAHKFAAWDKVDLLELVMPRLSDDELNMCVPGKGEHAGFTPLHSAADMGAARAFEFLWHEPRAAPSRASLDAKGRTALEIAKANGLQPPTDAPGFPPPPPANSTIASLAALARRRLEELESGDAAS